MNTGSHDERKMLSDISKVAIHTGRIAASLEELVAAQVDKLSPAAREVVGAFVHLPTDDHGAVHAPDAAWEELRRAFPMPEFPGEDDTPAGVGLWT